MSRETILFLQTPEGTLNHWADAALAAGHQVSVFTLETDAVKVSREFLSEATVVVDWLPRRQNMKETVLRAIEPAVGRHVLFLSSAHELMATRVASWLTHSDRLTGFSPLGMYLGKTCITLAAPTQLQESMKVRAESLMTSFQMEPCWVEDTPGMVMPRIYAMLANEAAFALQEKTATAEDIDTAMRLGTNYPMGPLQWADMVGLDVVLNILDNLWQVYKEERYRPCLLLQKQVVAGHLGRKSGQGFYAYPPTAPQGPVTQKYEQKKVSSPL